MAGAGPSRKPPAVPAHRPAEHVAAGDPGRRARAHRRRAAPPGDRHRGRRRPDLHHALVYLRLPRRRDATTGDRDARRVRPRPRARRPRGPAQAGRPSWSFEPDPGCGPADRGLAEIAPTILPDSGPRHPLRRTTPPTDIRTAGPTRPGLTPPTSSSATAWPWSTRTPGGRPTTWWPRPGASSTSAQGGPRGHARPRRHRRAAGRAWARPPGCCASCPAFPSPTRREVVLGLGDIHPRRQRRGDGPVGHGR